MRARRPAHDGAEDVVEDADELRLVHAGLQFEFRLRPGIPPASGLSPSAPPNRPFAIASGSRRAVPTATQQAPRLMNSAALSSPTPPVGISRISGNGPLKSLKNFGPDGESPERP